VDHKDFLIRFLILINLYRMNRLLIILTFFWNMPELVSAMAESQGVSINSYQSTVSGSSLEQHWKGEKDLLTRKKIAENNWV